ncbi:hypothetical protein [Sphingomonas sp. Leaf242]|uniref:hypothetical protein n=1 Tax=Sphingomonas sp. Leaf242 TaxID=1736304 RepID=UPI000715A9F2|nr:hypothetical protein [Sphingomonas sp. Leaf242]KQO13278.1 hypothetical protein ASF09_03245 [Sphingomonas sp. Leaf242]
MSRWSGTKVEGLADLSKALHDLPNGLGKGTLVRFGKKRLEPMRDTAKAKAPKDKGALSESIIVGTRQGRTGNTKKARGVDRAAVEVLMGPSEDGYPQAVPEEFGSVNNKPNSYMRAAWDEHNGDLLTGIAADLGSAIDKTAKRHARRQARRG